MSKQYLKLADVFPDNFNIDEIMVYNRESRKFNNATLEECVLHAISSHDELVAEVERLISVLYEVDRVLSEMQKNGVLAYGLDDLIDEVSLSIQSRSE